eukprot:4410696-Pyramimonas_sp.AAC.1
MFQDPAGDSSARQQRASIAQDCPLSPYLSIVVQSVMFFDVDARVKGSHSTERVPGFIPRSDLLCADDATLASS